MAKVDKEYTWRRQGMTHALEVVRENGIEALAKEVKMRGFTRVPLGVQDSEWRRFVDVISTNLYNMTITTAAMALHDGFGFGKDRLRKWKSVFDKKVEHAMNIDWLGEHYVSFEDYANYLNELYDVGIDINVLARVQKTNDALIPGYRQASVDRILEILKDGGFNEAAEYLDKKVR